MGTAVESTNGDLGEYEIRLAHNTYRSRCRSRCRYRCRYRCRTGTGTGTLEGTGLDCVCALRESESQVTALSCVTSCATSKRLRTAGVARSLLFPRVAAPRSLALLPRAMYSRRTDRCEGEPSTRSCECAKDLATPQGTMHPTHRRGGSSKFATWYAWLLLPWLLLPLRTSVALAALQHSHRAVSVPADAPLPSDSLTPRCLPSVYPAQWGKGTARWPCAGRP